MTGDAALLAALAALTRALERCGRRFIRNSSGAKPEGLIADSIPGKR